MPLLSIIIPVYNVEQYLRPCLDSVLSQTFSDYECILVDDGSPDNCPAICDEYAKKYSCFRVIHKENGGLSDARNVGIKAAAGEYIVLLDSDDLFADDKALENLCNVIEETKAEVIFNSNLTTFNAENFVSSDEFNKNFICGETLQFYKEIMRNRKILLAGWCFIVHRNFLLQHDLFFKEGILHEDEHWMPRVIGVVSKIAVNHNLFYAYRTDRPGSIKSAVTLKHCFDKISILEDILGWIKTEKTVHCQIIYKDFSVCLWINVFRSISLIDIQYPQESKQLLKSLRILSYALIYKASIKNLIYYVLIFFIYSNLKTYKYAIKLLKYLKG